MAATPDTAPATGQQEEATTGPGGVDLPSSWGRWGADDELGTLNLITDQVRARAVAEARTGVPTGAAGDALHR